MRDFTKDFGRIFTRGGSLGIDYTKKAIALWRSWLLRLTPSGRRRLALEHGALHSGTREPGLTNLDATGVVDVDADGHDIPVHWYQVGPSGDASAAGEKATDKAEVTVVFVHGFTLAGESWYAQFSDLRDRFPNARLLTMDLRGHGQTGEVPASLCTVTGAAHDVSEVIAACADDDSPIVVVGHSLGGLIALNLLHTAPQDIQDRIAGVALISTSIDKLSAQGVPQILASPVADAARDAMESAPKEVRKFREAIAKFMAPSLAVAVFSRPTNYDIIEFHAAMIHETPLATIVGYLGDLEEHEEFEAAPYLRGKPGAVIVGSKDDVTPREQADLIMEKWPEAHLVEVDHAGHMVIMEAAEEVNQALAEVITSMLEQ